MSFVGMSVCDTGSLFVFLSFNESLLVIFCFFFKLYISQFGRFSFWVATRFAEVIRRRYSPAHTHEKGNFPFNYS